MSKTSREAELRDAVKEAEQRVEDAWHCAPRSQTVDSPEVKAWKALPVYKSRPLHPLDAAKAKARAAAREDIRARWAIEDAKEAAEYPLHITRIASSVVGNRQRRKGAI
jgi:hypothetical protein